MTFEAFTKGSRRDGFSFEQDSKPTSNTAIFRRSKPATTSFEAVLVTQRYDSRTRAWQDNYPADDQWGFMAFSCVSLDAAKARCRELQERHDLKQGTSIP